MRQSLDELGYAILYRPFESSWPKPYRISFYTNKGKTFTHEVTIYGDSLDDVVKMAENHLQIDGAT